MGCMFLGAALVSFVVAFGAGIIGFLFWYRVRQKSWRAWLIYLGLAATGMVLLLLVGWQFLEAGESHGAPTEEDYHAVLIGMAFFGAAPGLGLLVAGLFAPKAKPSKAA
ncbi:MAG: hypothetical protein AAF657_26995 [Acidobacteriota bacterium]